MDYHFALTQIRRSLNDPRGPKASVLVGAGFSKNAVGITEGAGTFPDWSALTTQLANRLYTGSDREKVLRTAGAISSALRLAQEFETAHGRAALVEIVRESVSDESFRPGRAHELLMSLKWADVFTTNYDRLLEQATQTTSSLIRPRSYDLVVSADDLPLARRPRIVKLHGSLPHLEALVLTEDDFRRYPVEKAPFVNAVRASLTENIFCLIGFSGDDPNFLAWSGWVRDVLKQSVPPIYLFHLSPLQPFQRTLLERRRIVPIPVLEIFDEDDAGNALAELFTYLSQPADLVGPSWNLGPLFFESIFGTDSRAAKEPYSARGDKTKSLLRAATLWRRHRLEYRGWHIMYREGVTRIWSRTRFWLGDFGKTLFDALTPPQQIFVLSEFCWRCNRALWPLPDDLVTPYIDNALSSYETWRLDKEGDVGVDDASGTSLALWELDSAAVRLRMELLRHAREIGDGERFDSIYTDLESQISDHDSDLGVRNFLIHQCILRMLARLEHDEARESLRTWQTGNDVWMIRRVGLLLECGDQKLAFDLLRTMLRELVIDRNRAEVDYQARSTEGLALQLLLHCTRMHESEQQEQQAKSPKEMPSVDVTEPTGPEESRRSLRSLAASAPEPGDEDSVDEAAVRLRLNELASLGCDPTRVLEWLRLCNHRPQIPEPVVEREAFDINRVSRSSTDVSDILTDAYRLIRFIEEAGLPLVIHGVVPAGVCNRSYANASRIIAAMTMGEGIGLLFRSRDSKLLEEILSRPNLLGLTAQQVDIAYRDALSAAKRALQQLQGPPPTPRQEQDEWWARQFKVAATILGRLVVLLPSVAVLTVARTVLKAAGDHHLWTRVGIASELGTLVRRVCTALDTDSIEAVQETLSDIAAPQSERAQGEWVDPFKHIKWQQAPNALVRNWTKTLLSKLETATTLERQHVIGRLGALGELDLLTAAERKELGRAVYHETDEYGFPTNTGLLDAFILYLPRRSGANERKMFLDKYVEGEGSDPWANLGRTTDPSGLPRVGRRRTIRWSARDLGKILDKAESTQPSLIGQWKKWQGQQNEHPMFLSFMEGERRESLANLVDLLCTLEDVVMLSPNASEGHITRIIGMLERLTAEGFDITQIQPSLVAVGVRGSAQATAAIRDRLLSKENRIVLQASTAIARWCELSRDDRVDGPPEELLRALAILVQSGQHAQLPLLLNTAADVIAILGNDTPPDFIASIIDGLEVVLTNSDYKSNSKTRSIGEKILLRSISVRVVSVLIESGSDDDRLRRWDKDLLSDKFAEVRLAKRSRHQ